VYVDPEYAMNFQVSIDGGASSQYQFDGQLDGCPAIAGAACLLFNLTAYGIQSLPAGTHTLGLTLLNATGLYPFGPNLTFFAFNYATVNETNVSPIQPTSLTAPTSTTLTQPTSSTSAHTSTASTPVPTPPVHSTVQ
jgi:hypothetical protein